MADVTNFKIGNETYNVKDQTARANAQGVLTLVNNLKLNRFLKLANRRILFVGDSYGTGHGIATPFTELIIDELSNQSQNVSVGGAGFLAGSTFLTNLQGASVNNPDGITDVVVVGGYNDAKNRTYTYEQIKDAIDTFFEYSKSRFKNANHWLFCVGWCGNDPNIRNYMINVTMTAYADGAANNDVIFDYSITKTFHVYSLLDSSDYVHPNQEGQNRLATYVRSVLVGGSAKSQGKGYITWDVRDGSNWDTTIELVEAFTESGGLIGSGIIDIEYTKPLNFTTSGTVDILSKPFDSGYVMPSNTNGTTAFPINIRVNNSGDLQTAYLIFRNATGREGYAALALFTPLAISNVTSLRIYPFNQYLSCDS